MAVFEREQTFPVTCPNLAPVGKAVMDHFRAQGYEVTGEQGITQGWHISLTKGNMFQAVLGMKSALNITIEPVSAGVHAKAGIGIFGEQAIPTIISLFIFWPVLITQVWGLVQQHNLDQEAIAVVGRALQANGKPATGNTSFCTSCGTPIPVGGRFCPGCGEAV